MKLLTCNILSMAVLCMTPMAYAANLDANLTQESRYVSVILNRGDTLKINYHLKRSPIFREYEWYSYAVFCYADSGKHKIEYVYQGKKAEKSLPALLNYPDHIINQIPTAALSTDESGMLTITNIENNEFQPPSKVTCELRNKAGA